MSKEIENLDAVAEETVSTDTVSKSKQKREARAKAAQAEKAKRSTDSIITIVLGVLIGLIVVVVIGFGIASTIKNSGDETLITASSASSSTTDAATTTEQAVIPYSEGLTDDGFIVGANLDKVTLPDYESIVIKADEIAYTDENIDSEITTLLTYFKSYSDDAALTVANGDTINLDYVGYVDGVAFDGGNTQGNGTTLTIGSGTYIDNFEEQLIGAHPGDEVTVNVTFPENYGKDELNGKAAKFECKVNSIQVEAELNDEFVADNLAAYYNVTTVEELRNYIQEMGYKNNLQSYIANEFANMSNTEYIPDDYYHHLIDLTKKSDKYQFENMNAYYEQYLGAPLYESFSDYVQMTDQEYDEAVAENAKGMAQVDVSYEAFFKAKNLTVSEETKAEVTEAFAAQGGTENLGDGYLNQIAIKYTVIDYLANTLEIK